MRPWLESYTIQGLGCYTVTIFSCLFDTCTMSMPSSSEQSSGQIPGRFGSADVNLGLEH